MFIKSDKTKHEKSLTLFYTAFLFLWMTVLAPASRAGEGRLSVEQLERVYYVQQIFLILGFLSYAALLRLFPDGHFRRYVAAGVFVIFFAGVAVLLFADKAEPVYLFVARVVVLCLGGLGGAVYYRMSQETAKGTATARCMGIGSAAAVFLQYVLQVHWQSPLLPLFMMAAFLLLVARLLTLGEEVENDGEPASGKVRPSRLLTVCLISSLLLLFVGFYNVIIHHRTILSDSAAPGAYTWPRLMLIPCYLLFAAIGDRKQGRLVPITALVIALAAMLNSVLTGSDGDYWLNMCLFYCAVAAAVSYYTLSFWRLAPGTRHPALWAPMGRILDSTMVLVTAAIHLDTLPTAVVLGGDLAGVALIILMMAIGGDLNLTGSNTAEAPAAAKETEIPVESPALPDVPPLLSPEETLEKMRGRYDLTPREAEVLGELVLTEDKQTAISERLNIRVKTLQDYVTRIYRKTGAATRAGLTDLYHENRRQL